MMQKINLDFIHHPPLSTSTISRAGLIVLTLGIIMLTFTLFTYEKKKTDYQTELAALKANSSAQYIDETKADEPNLTDEELKQINQVVAALTTPWNTLLAALEGLDMHQVVLLSIEPDVKEKQLVLVGQAKDLEAALNYFESLEQLPMLSDVYLKKHQTDEETSLKPVNFSIVARWTP